MRRCWILAFALLLVSCGSSSHGGANGGTDGSVAPRDAGGALDSGSGVRDMDAGLAPVDGAPPPPQQKSAGVVSVAPTYTVAEEEYKYNPKVDKSGEGDWKVKSGPDGMKSEGEAIIWKPEKSQGGQHEVVVETTIKDEPVEQKFEVTVATSEKRAESVATPKSGGTVVVSNPNSKIQGSAVQVAPHTVDEPKSITVGELDKAPLSPNAVGTTRAVDFGPRGTVFSQPARISLPMPEGVVLSAARLGAFVYNPNGRWERVQVVSVDLANRLLVARATHFSVFAAFQSSLDLSHSLSRMPARSSCEGKLAASASLQSPLADVEATSINNRDDGLDALIEGGAGNVEDVLRAEGFSGSLRFVTVLEVSDGAGLVLEQRLLVNTLYAPGDGSATITHSDALGNVVATETYSDIVTDFATISSRLRGLATQALFSLDPSEDVALAARLHLVYADRDVSADPIGVADIGIATVDVVASAAASVVTASAANDVDCDGLLNTFDSLDNRLLASVRTDPSDVVTILSGESTTLRARISNTTEQPTRAWSVLDDGVASLDSLANDADARVFSAQIPGRYLIEHRATFAAQTLSSIFAVDVVARPVLNTAPRCSPSASQAVGVTGQALAFSATATDAETSADTLSVEWGLVDAASATPVLSPSGVLSANSLQAALTALNAGNYTVGCRAFDGDAWGAIGTAQVAIVTPAQNRAPIDLTLSPLSASLALNGTLTLRATATDPDGDALSFSWSVEGGSLGAPGTSGSESQVVFVGDSAGIAKVQVRVSDGSALSPSAEAILFVLSEPLGTVDADKDGWPAGAGALGDCDDQNAAIHPTATDVCGNQLDEDCDGVARSLDCDDDGYALASGDCDDANADVHPEAFEACDGVDNDCDTQVDDGFASGQACRVGVGACASTGTLQCSPDGQFTLCTAQPKAATPEVCDELDNDCDGTVDEDVCTIPVCVATAQTDAVCNSIDDDCDGGFDEDYASLQTVCGVGACLRSGSTRCSDGTVLDSCQAGVAAASDGTCDGIDDDCDGQNDENFAIEQTVCGRGACANEGSLTCVAGKLANSCEELAALDTSDATCDEIDDDCDGSADEEYVEVETTCGTGACAAVGHSYCEAGQQLDTCEAGPAGTFDACDGIDNDCDGQTDEDHALASDTCGTGACVAGGELECVNGKVVSSCLALEGAPNDASCDGVDDNCNGTNDEDFVVTATECGVGACGSNGQEQCVAGGVVDTCKAGNPAPSDASCNGVDDNCNGINDEEYVITETTCGVGACGSNGQKQCVAGGVVDTCEAGNPAPSDASCDGVDDNCNGTNDEDFVVTATECGVGACGSNGQEQCVAGGVVDTCKAGNPAPSDASCNGVDDNCNGINDEEYVITETTCGVGACGSNGQKQCVAGGVVDTCEAGNPASSDASCDGVDDNCNGTNDEDFVVTATECGVGACGSNGQEQCVAGGVVDTCKAGNPAPSDASCNGIDDNCNGINDEEYAITETTCGVGACGSNGQKQCVAGGVVDTCEAGNPASSDASCDGVDDNCNGTNDEDFVVTATECGVGACGSNGQEQCVAGGVVDTCKAGNPAPSDASCNGVDDNCNGINDEEYVITETTCGVGACGSNGQKQCVAGGVVDTCEAGNPAPSDASCDGVDDNCNGTNDEDFVVTATECGVGACGSNGQEQCVAGGVVDTCKAGNPAPSDASCNGIDDNCNGINDEEYVITETTCGVGACGSNGQKQCVAGGVVDTCEAGNPAPSDASCDGVDDNCNGTNDEEYAITETTCGVGACGSNGQKQCVAGGVVDTCKAGNPAPSDASCNGVDDNCNGINDEEYVITETTCGVGACGSNGQKQCVAGGVVDTCKAGNPAPSDASCNGIDDDCNGTNDEEYAITETTCGVGACGSNGQKQCVAGGVVDTCKAGNPAPSDASCNGIDDNCNGINDEEYVITETTCGVGACGSNGQKQCVAGGVVDTCKAGNPAPSDASCDGVDDNCNAQIDEEYQSSACTTAASGACAQGASFCLDALIGCEQVVFPDAEVCNDIDDDCNGDTDDLAVTSCASGELGQCESGLLACDGSETLCVPINEPVPETCNGVDDDCNGDIDDVEPLLCSTGELGLCSQGHLACDAQGFVCIRDQSPLPEICNDVDDDCNGSLDDLAPISCSTAQPGLCAQGHVECSVDGEFCAQNEEPRSEICNELDDDCNGVNDDLPPSSCSTGLFGLCGEGHFECGAGEPQCVANQDPLLEICNGIDDDCNGAIDDDDACGGTCTCDVSGGECDFDPQTEEPCGCDVDCGAGCEPQGPEECTDRVDNDCNGLIDEADPKCGGECLCDDFLPGTCALDGGGAPCPCDPDCGAGCIPDGPELCFDGLDNDCDGILDTQDPLCCSPEGPEQCFDARDNDCNGLIDSGDPVCGGCSPQGPEQCFDGIDNDCNGLTDASDPMCACVPAGPEQCIDGLDNDCNGKVDAADPVCGGGCACDNQVPGNCAFDPIAGGPCACDPDCGGGGPPGDRCESAQPINPGMTSGSLTGYADNIQSSCFGPGMVDRFFQISIPSGRIDVGLTGVPPMNGWALYQGTCGALTQVFCGNGPSQPLPPGVYYIAIEGSPGSEYQMNLAVMP